MNPELLFERLKSASSPEEKAALVAESLIEDLPSNVRKIALWCGLYPWFSVDVIKELTGGNDKDLALRLIVSLPFVEEIGGGYSFHATTHRGLLKKYRDEKPNELIAAFQTLAELFNQSTKELRPRVLRLFGYVITDQGTKAEDLLMEILALGDSSLLSAIEELNEAEEFCVADGIGLTPRYWHTRGQFALLGNQLDLVIDYCDKAIWRDDRYAQAFSTRAVAKARQGNLDAAFEDANLAIGIRPDAFAYRCRAAVFIKQKSFKDAIFDLTRAIRVDPEDVLAYTERALLYLATGKRTRAFEDLDSALNMTDDRYVRGYIYVNYARAMIIAEEWEKALEYLDKALEIEPTSGSYRRKADIFAKLNRTDEARECYERALKLDSENPYAYLGRGKLLLNLGVQESAIQDLEKASLLGERVDIVPQSVMGEDEITLRLWEAYLRAGEFDKAEEQRDILLRTTNQERLFHVLLFCRKYQLFETLLDVSDRLINASRGNRAEVISLHTAAGYALNCLGRYQEALAHFDQVTSLDSGGVKARINMGISNWGLGNLKEAYRYFELANRLANRKPEAKDFERSQKVANSDLSDRVWLIAMLKGPSNALHNLENHLVEKDTSLENLYDLRDWCSVVLRVPEGLPDGFENLSGNVDKLIIERGGDSIYNFALGT